MIPLGLRACSERWLSAAPLNHVARHPPCLWVRPDLPKAALRFVFGKAIMTRRCVVIAQGAVGAGRAQ